PLQPHEARLWQGLFQSNTLGELSNSFLLGLAKDGEALNSVLPEKTMTKMPAPRFDYLKPAAPKQENKSNPREAITALQTSVAKLRAENESLRQHRDILANSVGSRLFRKLKRLLGRDSL
ncbi:MAG: hypothetical protein AAF197_08635, partial [Pseudomonadota bacterium]